ncbi:MAG TPA: FadR/GntR family transcriptional regulator [Microbacterium sp.]|uniref:FadR/GntR family transcriptional regulator n=1 Tax=Microbacterium sp. TaxID=51671 RepID=UPI002B7CD24E|nr:FadR/GntR family transcriptional regulator [Microbacterium sp.]HWI31069.1 FadR/GntR family transcriptional regulator [Microbacterium sp.]
MARKTLVTQVVDAILDDIVAGTIPIGDGLPSEADIAESHDVSRLTVREAIRTLQAQGVLRVETGKGSFVNPVSEWTSFEAVLRVSAAGSSDDEVAVQLLELRRIFEVGAAALAAERRTDSDLKRMSALIDVMKSAHHRNDVAGFVEADIAFHDVILKASHNIFLAAMFEPLTRVLRERREQTSRVREIQIHAISEHEGVLRALESGDPGKAREAMQSHMTQTLDDLQTYVLTNRPAV